MQNITQLRMEITDNINYWLILDKAWHGLPIRFIGIS